jgi:hypothetical protein
MVFKMNNDWYGLRPKETRRGKQGVQKQGVKNNKNMTKKSIFLTICANQANIILYPKRHIFFGAFTASG